MLRNDMTAKLDVMAGAETESGKMLQAKVRVSMAWQATECPCDNGKTCQCPGCAKTANGMGHYP